MRACEGKTKGGTEGRLIALSFSHFRAGRCNEANPSLASPLRRNQLTLCFLVKYGATQISKFVYKFHPGYLNRQDFQNNPEKT